MAKSKKTTKTAPKTETETPIVPVAVASNEFSLVEPETTAVAVAEPVAVIVTPEKKPIVLDKELSEVLTQIGETELIDNLPLFDPQDFDDSEAALLVYDIPQEATEAELPEDRIYNPSAMLRRISVRLNKSMWVIKPADIPYAWLEEMNRKGADIYPVAVTAKFAPKLMKRVSRAMYKDLLAQETRTDRTVRRAEEKLNSPDGDPTEKLKVYEKAIKDVVKRVEVMCAEFEKQGKRFDLNLRTLPLKETLDNVRQTQQAMLKRAGLLRQAIEIAKATKTLEMAALAKAAEQGVLPAGVLADAIQENSPNADGTAEALREVFAGTGQ